MLCYNILGDNGGSISDILRIHPITAGSILHTVKRVALKKENSEPSVTFKRTEWSKFIDYFGIIIEANQSRMGKNNIYFVYIGYIPNPSSVSYT